MRAVKFHINKIGTSRGIRITTRPRYSWDKQFQAMAQRSDDQLRDEPTATHWDRNKWKW